MIIPVYSAVSVILLIYLVSIPKKLHIAEILFVWLVVTFLNTNFSTIVTLNLKWIQLIELHTPFWGFIMNRNIITPALFVWLMHIYSASYSVFKKAAATVCVIAALAGFEFLGDRLGITEHPQWKIGYSIPIWLLIVLLTYAALWGFRQLRRKEAIAE